MRVSRDPDDYRYVPPPRRATRLARFGRIAPHVLTIVSLIVVVVRSPQH